MSKVLVNSAYYIINIVGKDSISDIEYALKYISLAGTNKQKFVQ